MVYIILVLLIATAVFVVLKTTWKPSTNPNLACLEKLKSKNLIKGNLETKHLKCSVDIDNLNKGIKNPPPKQKQTFARSDMDCETQIKNINNDIADKKLIMKYCNAVRKNKIRELRRVVEKESKISDEEFKEILRKFEIVV
jgi:hypothetical protein